MASHFHWRFQGPASGIPFDPALRKATTMMKMVVEGLRNMTTVLDFSNYQQGEISTFLGSLHGEIEPTLNYLKGLAQSQHSRPFLFQNSLHHSTTGFASQKFQWVGPSYSICCIREPQREILQAGLLHGKDEPLLLIHGESFPAELADISCYEPLDSCEVLFLNRKAVRCLNGSFHFKNFADVSLFLQEKGSVCALP